MISWYRYVPHDQLDTYRALGWEFVECPVVYHHDVYSSLLTWTGHGDPEIPEMAERN